jgi:hypothetical protein
MTVGIQGNVSPEQLQLLADDFSETYNGPEPNSIFYVAACSRTDHGPGPAGAALGGFWSASAQHDFKDALRDAMHHEHREALVARCDTDVLTCGLVWPAK